MKNVRNAAACAGVLFVVSYFVPHDPYYDDFWYGGFAKSVVPRLKHEVNFLLNVYGYTAERTKIIADTQERFARTPSNLAKLHHANVQLILIESYGQAVFDQPLLEERSRASVDAFETEITKQGFSIASGTLGSPTYGGQSWLAHSTLSTGVHTTDPLGYELLSTQHPKTIARFFRDAGYHTVLVHPGTMRPWPKGEFYQFDQKYYAWMFDYAGPSYGWATMPDQFVLDFVRRNELEKRDRPLFDQVVLVTSHAPWNEQPPAVDDWSTIKNGAIFNALPVVRYPIVWPYFEEAQEAYIRSIIYDIDVLKQYIASYIHDDSLVILLGDHQPVGEIAGEGEKRGVPVHVMSRDAALVEPFLSRGYVRGMRPTLVEPPPPMADFLPHLLEDFSTPDGPGAAAPPK
jgi:hypothetical protein